MGNNIIIEESGKGGIILYQTPDGQTSLEVKLENETVWLTRQQMAMLFGRDVKTIGKHINNALREELAGESVVAKFATPKKYGRREGFEQTQYPEYYSLEMITSVGYRVKSRNGIIFRRWANSVLNDYCFNVKGFITLWSDFFVDNPASGRVMEKCGFVDTGKEKMCSHLFHGDDRPVHIMRLDYAL